MSNEEARAPSLLGKINILFSSFAVACVTIFSGIFIYHQSYAINEERRIFLKSLGATIVSTIERPFSLGDYSEVQSFLSVKKLPPFINSIQVVDINNIERASGQRDYTPTCNLQEKQSFPILDGGTVIIESSSCDLRDSFQTLLIAMSVLALLIIVLSIASGKAILVWAWKPVKKVIEQASGANKLSQDIINAAGKELQPLLAMAFQAYKSELYDEILHNLASPVKTLKQIIRKSEQTQISDKDLREANNSILQIESYIKAKHHNDEPSNNIKIAFLDDIVESIVHSKKLEMAPQKKNIEISFAVEKSDYGAFAKINPSDARDILSNMINNSFDAIGSNGKIELRINQVGNYYKIAVWDSGKGIEKFDLSNIFSKGISLKNSSGLGLSHAQKVLQKIGGEITVTSEVGSWTEFCIKIPLVHRPPWFIPQIDITHIDHIAVVDDEEIHISDWQNRKELKNIKITYLVNREALAIFLKKIQSKYTFYS